MPRGQQTVQFWQLCWPMFFVSKSESDLRFKSFPKETIFSGKSSGHGKSSVDAAVDIIFAAVKCFFCSKPKSDQSGTNFG